MKRSHSEITGTERSSGDGSGDDKAKRAKPATTPAAAALTDALALLQKHAKELKDCLKAVRKEDVAASGPVVDRLGELSKTLLPAFQVLGGSAADESEQHTSQSTPPATQPAVAATSLPLSPLPPQQKASGGPSTRFSNRIPPLGSLTAWTPEDILPDDAYPPPLPRLEDAALERMALTHHGMRGNDWDASYENLEFLGDAFIYYLASELLSQTFVDLGPGRLSQLRERLLRNSNLSSYTRRYGLAQRARIPPEFSDETRIEGKSKPASQKEREKVQADLFEAHVGALIRLDGREGNASVTGVDRATRWLRSLWAGTLAREIREEYRRRAELASTGRLVLPREGGTATATAAVATADTTTSSNNSPAPATTTAAVAPNRLLPKVELAQRIGCRGVVIRYEDVRGKQRLDRISNLPLFTVAVWVDAWGTSACLGHGSGLSKKDAGSKAAEAALGNKKQMQFYEEKKRAFVAAQEAQAAAGM